MAFFTVSHFNHISCLQCESTFMICRYFSMKKLPKKIKRYTHTESKKRKQHTQNNATIGLYWTRKKILFIHKNVSSMECSISNISSSGSSTPKWIRIIQLWVFLLWINLNLLNRLEIFFILDTVFFSSLNLLLFSHKYFAFTQYQMFACHC